MSLAIIVSIVASAALVCGVALGYVWCLDRTDRVRRRRPTSVPSASSLPPAIATAWRRKVGR